MQFNVVPRTGGLAINRKNRGKREVRRHNSHSVQPSMVAFEKQLPVVRDQSVRWLVDGYKAINNPELVKKVRSEIFSHRTDIIIGFSTPFHWREGF